MKNDTDTKVFALGGLGEIGKNMYCISKNDEIIIIDAGVMFPENDLLGIDYVLADYTYLKQNENKIKALFITHGHEDHIGGIPFILQNLNIPKIYAPNVALKLIKLKLEDRNINYNNLIEYTENSIIKFDNIKVEFFRTTHSIPDSYGIMIETNDGIIVTTGDFKFDLTPIGPMANIQKMANISEKGVTLLMSDSTNALSPGFSNSESIVDETLGEIFRATKTRIILATFASNIYRLTHIIETCRENNRKIAVFGRSMNNNIEIAKECGYIKDDGIFVNGTEANNLKPSEVCLLCTGSQGEPLAALSRIANGTDKNITLMPEDTVIFSSSPIPGNALSINRVINKLYLKGAKVYTNTTDQDIHTSGHAKQDELKLLIRIFKPKYFMPVHGEYRMLKAHADLGVMCGVPKENTFIMQNGEILSINKGVITRNSKMPINDVYVDGNRVGEISSSVIKDRKIMSTDGVLIVILNIDTINRKLVIDPNVTTRGFVIVNENSDLLSNIQNKVKEIVLSDLVKSNFNLIDLKNRIILEINSYIIELTGRRPIILPMILEVKNTNEN